MFRAGLMLVAIATAHPAAAKPRFTLEAAQALQAGTSESEAIAALGAPQMRVMRPDGSRVLIWRRSSLLSGKLEAATMLFGPDGRLVDRRAISNE